MSDEPWPVEGSRCLQLAPLATHECRRSRYQQAYGVVPSFRTGIHSGRVVAGEIGDRRKQIVFVGDAVNTASRAQVPSAPVDVGREAGRFSARRKTGTILRLLRGESLDSLARELGVTAATLAGWREAFLTGGQAALRSRPADERDGFGFGRSRDRDFPSPPASPCS